MKKILLLFFFPALLNNLYAQTNPLFKRLQAMESDGKMWVNVDGYSISLEDSKFEFTDKGLKKVYKAYSVSYNDEIIEDSANIGYINRNFTREEPVTDDLSIINSHYFIKNKQNLTTVIIFSKAGETDIEFENQLIPIMMERKIPAENFVSTEVKKINFAGRIIELEKACFWNFLNDLNCPYFGQISWSYHEDIDKAIDEVVNQLIIDTNINDKIIANDMIKIDFEKVLTRAKRIIYDYSGSRSAQGKQLTKFYVAEKIRDHYISCVLSFWNNDEIDNSGLPPILEEVMTLK